MYQHTILSIRRLAAVASFLVFLSSTPVVRAQVRTVTPATPADTAACPQSANHPPVTVTVQQDLGGGNAGDAVTVVEEVRGGNIDVGSISAPGSTSVEQITGIEGRRPVGDFPDSVPVGNPADGNVGCIGEAGEWLATEAGGVYTLGDSWGDIWTSGDHFTYVYAELRGDFNLSAHIVSRDPHPVSEWGRGGVMARDDLTPLSRHRMVVDPLHADGLRCTIWGGRTVHHQSSDWWVNQGQLYDWYRITRVGDSVSGWVSDDGATWIQASFNGVECTGDNPLGADGAEATPFSDELENAPETMLVGLAVSGNGGTVCADVTTVTYDNVQLQGELVLEGEMTVDGAEITWETTLGAVDQGLTYEVDFDAGRAKFSGTVGENHTTGNAAIDVVQGGGATDYGPFAGFGDGLTLTNGHNIGEPCGGTDITVDGQDMTITGAGYDIWDHAESDGDQFMYAYGEMTGDFQAQVTVAARGGAPSDWGKHGLMVREDCTRRSRYVYVLSVNAPDNTRFHQRAEAGGTSENTPAGGLFDDYRVSRVGDTFFASVFNAGSWQQIGQTTWSDAPATVLVGLAVTSGMNDVDLKCTPYAVTFTNFSVNTTPVPPPVRTLEAACPGGGPVTVTVQQPVPIGTDPAEVITVVERLQGDATQAGLNAMNGGQIVPEILGGKTGIFGQAVPIPVGGNNPGCEGDPGEWVASFDAASDQYTVGDSWGDVWTSGDTFTFVFNRIQGDFVLTAHTLERNPQADSGWGRNALMVRQDTGTGSRYNMAFDALFGANHVGAGGVEDGPNRWGLRETHNNQGDSDWCCGGTDDAFDWYQIERVDDVVTGFVSEDGGFWELLGSMDWGAGGAAPESVLVGIAVSGNISGSRNCSQPPTTVVWDEAELILGQGAKIIGGDLKVAGYTISWNVSREDLANGVSYSIDIPAGVITMDGDAGGQVIEGPSRLQIAPCLPVRSFDCPEVSVTQELNGRDPDEVVRVVENIRGVTGSGDVTAANGGEVTETEGGTVGIFAQATPIAAGGLEAGCIGEAGQWIGECQKPGGDPCDGGADDQYIVGDSWGDIWTGGDTFTYVYSTVRGNFALTARISARRPHPTLDWGRNGLMVRQDLGPVSKFFMTTEYFKSDADVSPDTARWSHRPSHLESDTTWTDPGIGPRDWYRVERIGDVVHGSASEDGVTWEVLGSSAGFQALDTVLVGLAVSGRVFEGAVPPLGCSESPSIVEFNSVELTGGEVVGVGGLAGVAVTWDVPRSQLVEGVSYRVGGPQGSEATISGSVGNQTTAGPAAVTLCGKGGFRRGDANGDGSTNLADAVATFNFLFLGGDEPPCLDAADSNDVDNALNLTDGVFLLNFLFLGGDPIPPPGPFDCGPEPAESPFTFGCDQYVTCDL